MRNSEGRAGIGKGVRGENGAPLGITTVSASPTIFALAISTLLAIARKLVCNQSNSGAEDGNAERGITFYLNTCTRGLSESSTNR